ncbi:exopolysaccharide biosynthesis polyprenyl glycosylphosphotransferase [Maribellus comscasis]|uniref:Exopolysaccharide biosynthesis polyprenyl glycosylphosphotransferase n=2 Tax=Maribellus comscasis TaxID=2681766 RepID=A0A6I6JYA5_9BACT|nr:exopolysaccharide biosynthesis polyprenyl glycosylphosphotransferase [Maribellus comscasis]
MTNCKDTEEKYKNRFKIISESKKLDELFREETIDELIYCKAKNNQHEIRNYISNCAEVGISFHHFNETAQSENGIQSKLLSFRLIDQLPLVTYKNTPDNYLGLKMKIAFDFLFSFTVIILGFPIFLMIAFAIQLEGSGPVFFKQERIGLNGRRFLCFKFRTMAVGSEALQASLLGQNEQDGPVFKIANDPRVTRIGRFLRKTSLDELPQFVNILRGEMSVVGPRPPIPTEVEKYEQWQKRRLSMKPGITCTWQVSRRNNISFEQWMRLDLEYIDNWSLTNDFLIVFKTIKTVITATGR